MRKQEYICKNPHIFETNLLFAKYVHKLQKKKKKTKAKIKIKNKNQRTLSFKKDEI